MKRICVILQLFCLALCLTSCSELSSQPEAATTLVIKAQSEKDAGNFSRAKTLLQQARTQFLASGDSTAARDCSNRIEDIDIIRMTYPDDLATLRRKLAESFSSVPESGREAWIRDNLLETIVIDGKPYYYEDVVTNVKFRNKELFRQDSAMYNGYKQGYELLLPVSRQAAAAGAPFSNRIRYQGTGELSIPRAKLPARGLFRLWVPVPIKTDPQPNVTIVSVTPEKYVQQLPGFDKDIGLIYLEIPLEKLTDDLKVAVVFTFDHLEQRFVIDPALVGSYDKGSELYRTYTASRGNTLVTPEITATALSVVGNETNPYLAAQKLYRYVVDKIQYSHMPHLALWPRGEAESSYVQRNRYGDCGAQSLYFAALCRSIGIPARTTGGWQLFSGRFDPYFWGEFYLPNYGWIPVDPTAAKFADYLDYVSADDKRNFHDFFFGGQDHFRAVVQRDIDVPLIPAAGAPIFFQMAIQYPTALCDTMDTNPGILVSEHWSMKAAVLP